MDPFTEAEKAFLKDLQRNAIWSEILEKLRGSGRGVPAYRPGKPVHKPDKKDGLVVVVDDGEQQHRDWIFASGVDRGTKGVLKRLVDG